MKRTYTYTGTAEFSDETMELLNNISKASRHIILLERAFGFIEIHKESGVEYTTMDILEKGL